MMVVARYPRRSAFFAMVKLRDPPHVKKIGTNDHSHGKKCLSPSFITTPEGGRTVPQKFHCSRVSTPLAGFSVP